MFIRDLYARPEPAISFEFFPPKNAEAEATLFASTIPGLKELGATYFSVTYGAGGSTRDTTLRIVQRIRQQFGVEAMSHLTCVGASQPVVDAYLDEALVGGVTNILALRGDPPRGQSTFVPTDASFRYATDLIPLIRQRGTFCIGAACYPEGHQECSDKLLDWDRAAAKVEAGADFLITQLFYDWNDFLALEDYLRNRRGVKVPIIPGVLPFLTAEQIKRFTSLCGSRLPPPLLARLEQLAHDDESVRQVGVEVCTEICQKALQHGVRGLHFYCLNRVASCAEVVRNLGLA